MNVVYPEDRCPKKDATNSFIPTMEFTKIGPCQEAASESDPSHVDVRSQLSHRENKNVITEYSESGAQLSTVTRPDLTSSL
jgi:hypothetical protein